MINFNSVRPGGAAGYAAAPSQQSGKYARGFAGRLRCSDAVQSFYKKSLVQQGKETPEAGPGAQGLREKYMYSSMAMDQTGCTVWFGFGSPGEPWDPAEMTGAEREDLWNEVSNLAREMGLDPASLPIYLVPPGVTLRINAEPGGAYGDFIYGRLQGGAPSHWLVVDEKGRLTELSAGDAVQVPQASEDSGEDFWKARMERQAEYMRYVQQVRLEHAQETTRQFAALQGFAQESEAARGLPDGAGGSAAELLTAG